MTQHATGGFDVKVTPVPLQGPAEDAALSRMTLEKTFHGDLEAVGKGQMLAASADATKGSGAYVALERVTGKLGGRSGSFMLQHLGVMAGGAPTRLEVLIVPDSGTDQLVGVAGALMITIRDGKHFYDFDYSLPGD
jgi:hypothetical protein